MGLVIIFALWAIVHVFAPFSYPVEGTPNPLTEIIYNISTVAPLLLLIILLCDKYVKKIRLINSEKFWMCLFGTGLVAVALFMIWTQVLGHYICYRGLMTTAGLLIILAMWVTRKYKDKIGVWQAAFVGMLAAGFTYGFWETIYQVFGYVLIWGGWTGKGNFIYVMEEMLCFMIPFVSVCIMYKIKPNLQTLFCSALFAVLLWIWIVAFDYWSVVIFVGENHTPILHEPIRWNVYYLIKSAQVVLVCAVLSMGFKTDSVKTGYPA